MKLLDTPMGTSPSGGRVWLRWLALAIFVAAMAFAFVNLGLWQLDRLDQRRERNDTVVAHEESPVAEFAEVFNRTITEADQWQRVAVEGTFDAEHQFVVRYRTNAGAAGYEVLTPLHSTDGRWVLISRGFAVRQAARDFPSVLPAPPSGQVSVVGFVRRDEQGPTDAVTPTGNSVRLINSAAMSGVLPYPLVNGYISALEMTPPQSGELIPVQPPELTEGNHFSYALQWFMFAGLAGVGLVLLIRSDVRSLRRPTPAPVEEDSGRADEENMDRAGRDDRTAGRL